MPPLPPPGTTGPPPVPDRRDEGVRSVPPVAFRGPGGRARLGRVVLAAVLKRRIVRKAPTATASRDSRGLSDAPPSPAWRRATPRAGRQREPRPSPTLDVVRRRTESGDGAVGAALLISLRCR